MTIRQFRCLGKIGSEGMTVDQALELNQVTFGSICYRKWVVFSASLHRFVRSATGETEYELNRTAKLTRLHNTGVFSRRVKYKAVIPINKKKAAA